MYVHILGACWKVNWIPDAFCLSIALLKLYTFIFHLVTNIHVNPAHYDNNITQLKGVWWPSEYITPVVFKFVLSNLSMYMHTYMYTCIQ